MRCRQKTNKTCVCTRGQSCLAPASIDCPTNIQLVGNPMPACSSFSLSLSLSLCHLLSSCHQSEPVSMFSLFRWASQRLVFIVSRYTQIHTHKHVLSAFGICHFVRVCVYVCESLVVVALVCRTLRLRLSAIKRRCLRRRRRRPLRCALLCSATTFAFAFAFAIAFRFVSISVAIPVPILYPRASLRIWSCCCCCSRCNIGNGPALCAAA